MIKTHCVHVKNPQIIIKILDLTLKDMRNDNLCMAEKNERKAFFFPHHFKT